LTSNQPFEHNLKNNKLIINMSVTNIVEYILNQANKKAQELKDS